jgi:hypothetical protein
MRKDNRASQKSRCLLCLPSTLVVSDASSADRSCQWQFERSSHIFFGISRLCIDFTSTYSIFCGMFQVPWVWSSFFHDVSAIGETSWQFIFIPLKNWSFIASDFLWTALFIDLGWLAQQYSKGKFDFWTFKSLNFSHIYHCLLSSQHQQVAIALKLIFMGQ